MRRMSFLVRGKYALSRRKTIRISSTIKTARYISASQHVNLVQPSICWTNNHPLSMRQFQSPWMSMNNVNLVGSSGCVSWLVCVGDLLPRCFLAKFCWWSLISSSMWRGNRMQQQTIARSPPRSRKRAVQQCNRTVQFCRLHRI